MSLCSLRKPAPGMNRTGRCALFGLALLAFVLPASAQTVNLFPANYQEQWTRIAIPPTHPVTSIPQWHIDAAKRTILCDGNGGHDWLRFGKELHNFTFHVQWRFTKLPGTPKYNSGVFFLNDEDGTVWHQAQTSPGGGYIFGATPLDGKMTKFNLSKEMTENRIKPAGKWNTYDIRCVSHTCTLAVNGAVVNTLHVDVEKGYIGLESEGYRIEFKNFKVQELP
ncbi:MAG: DUF1080 domain-containing protein [Terracidiphilus sp.]|nr:DUF1080 domain-containing protein [Terracidiphilus sp.]